MWLGLGIRLVLGSRYLGIGMDPLADPGLVLPCNVNINEMRGGKSTSKVLFPPRLKSTFFDL